MTSSRSIYSPHLSHILYDLQHFIRRISLAKIQFFCLRRIKRLSQSIIEFFFADFFILQLIFCTKLRHRLFSFYQFNAIHYFKYHFIINYATNTP